jgi:hypothetical protein
MYENRIMKPIKIIFYMGRMVEGIGKISRGGE